MPRRQTLTPIFKVPSNPHQENIQLFNPGSEFKNELSFWVLASFSTFWLSTRTSPKKLVAGSLMHVSLCSIQNPSIHLMMPIAEGSRKWSWWSKLDTMTDQVVGCHKVLLGKGVIVLSNTPTLHENETPGMPVLTFSVGSWDLPSFFTSHAR